MVLLEKIRRINDANFEPWDEAEFDSVRELFKGECYEMDSDVPAWFHRMVDAVLNRQACSFCYESDPRSDSATGSLLLELISYGWNVDDYGEAAELRFPVTGITVVISREARDPVTGKGCKSCTVTVGV